MAGTVRGRAISTTSAPRIWSQTGISWLGSLTTSWWQWEGCFATLPRRRRSSACECTPTTGKLRFIDFAKRLDPLN